MVEMIAGAMGVVLGGGGGRASLVVTVSVSGRRTLFGSHSMGC